MERNEIKLRGKLLSGDIHRHRNYEAIMKKYKRSALFKRTFRFFFYSLLVTMVVLLLILLGWYVVQMKRKQEKEKKEIQTAQMLTVKSLRTQRLFDLF